MPVSTRQKVLIDNHRSEIMDDVRNGVPINRACKKRGIDNREFGRYRRDNEELRLEYWAAREVYSSKIREASEVHFKKDPRHAQFRLACDDPIEFNPDRKLREEFRGILRDQMKAIMVAAMKYNLKDSEEDKSEFIKECIGIEKDHIIE